MCSNLPTHPPKFILRSSAVLLLQRPYGRKTSYLDRVRLFSLIQVTQTITPKHTPHVVLPSPTKKGAGSNTRQCLFFNPLFIASRSTQLLQWQS
jgi:hypothetical protein